MATRQVQAFQRASSAVEGRNGFWRSCTTISGDCPSSAIRYGQSCITSIVGPQMGRRQRHGFSGRRFHLFETVLAHIQDLPRPRQRQHELALKH